MNREKYSLFIKLLKFNEEKYSAESVFKDFISIFAISISNKVMFNLTNKKRYDEILSKYESDEQGIFYMLSSELTKLICNEKEPCDILGEIYQKITQKSYLRLINEESSNQIIGKKLQGIININNKTKNGEMVEANCGSGSMILAYASILKIFKINYKTSLKVTAIDTELLNVFMTYIQLYFYDIDATVILSDKNNKELMRLYTTRYEDEVEELMVA